MEERFSKILEQIDRREIELQQRKEQLKGLVLDITPEEKEKVLKKSEKDFFYFAKKVFPEYCTKPFSRLHKDILRFYLSSDRTVDLVAGPPEHGKTAIYRIAKIWGGVFGKKHYQIKVSETMDLSLLDMASIRLEFEENARMIFLFGNLKTEGKWDESAFKIKPTSYNKSGCWYEAFAFGVPPTGRLREQFRPDGCDIDDLENYRKSGNIKISREKLEFINNDIIPRMSMDSSIIWFGNNARKTMAINIIIEMEEDKRKRDFPAFRIHLYQAWDRKRKEPLWKEVFKFKNEEEMRIHFKVGVMTWNGNYQQCPMVPEGIEFKLENWREFKKLPADALGIIYCDPAAGKSGCYKVGVPIFFSRETTKFYVMPAFVRQCDWEPYFLWMYEAYNQFQNQLRFIGWESDFYQEQFLLFKKLYASTKDKPALPIRPIESRGSGQKEERIRSISTPYEYGSIYFSDEFLLTKDGQEGQL